MEHRLNYPTLRRTAMCAALAAVFMATPARAEETPEVAALRRQVVQLTEQINQLAAQQQTSDQKQQKLETQLDSVAQSAVVTPKSGGRDTARPVASRYAGLDVRLFGSFDAYVESQQTGAGMINRLASSGSGYTQLGFDASRDIGNGFRAFGDVRLSYQTDNGKTNSTVRTFNTATVGIASSELGTLQVGRMGTQVGIALSAFRLVRLGTGNFIYNPFTTLTHDNTIRYTSPNFSHMQASASVDLGETVDTQKKGRGWSGMLKYDDGKTVVLGGVFSTNAPTDISTANDKVTIQTLGASHNFGLFKPFVVVQRAKSNLVPLSLNQVGWYAGVDIPAGPGSLRFEAEGVKNKAWAEADAKSLNVRYDWLLGPDLTMYFTYTKIFDEANVYYPIVGTGGFAAVAQSNTNPLNPTFNTSLNGKSPHAVAVGIKFDF
jgi:predicted porin